jgi:predicted TIM-barrel fold metal-dependent hydrolase
VTYPGCLSRRDFLHATTAACTGVGLQAPARALDKSSRVIDSHVHVWKTDSSYPWPKELKNPPTKDALPQTLLGQMATHGVAKTVLVHYIGYRWDCRYTAQVLNANRNKFMGVCRVDPQADTAADDLKRWVADYGFHGVRLSPAAGKAGDWINDRPRMDRLVARVAQLKIPLCILCRSTRLADVGRLIERHNDALDVCIDHMADCPIDQPSEWNKLLALGKFARVFVKISHLWSLSRQRYPYRDTHDAVKRVYDAFGPHRLMWGSDWPLVDAYCDYGKALALYREEIAFLTAEDRRWILGQTALRLWPFT